MKHLILLIALLCTFYGFSFAQKLPELEKLKELKLLEHTREDVRRILSIYKLQNVDYRYVSPRTHQDTYITENVEIQISYSRGKCNSNAENLVWDIDEWKVAYIDILPKNSITLNELGLELSKFKRENTYTNRKDYKIYHRRDLGIAIQTEATKVITISLEPPQKYFLMLCDKKLAERMLKTSSYFDPLNNKRDLITCYRAMASVNELVLSETEIVIEHKKSDNSSSIKTKEIAVLTVPYNPDNDVLTYNYSVSGGKVIGVGGKEPSASDKVFWDLSDAKPGTYTITAAVDNGCGFCGKMITKTVTVKECADCKKP